MKMNQEASLELNDKVLFKDLKICKSEEKRKKKHYQVTPTVPKGKKLRVLTVKSTFLRRIRAAFLASAFVQDGNLQMSDGLDNRCQVVWTCEHFFLSSSESYL